MELANIPFGVTDWAQIEATEHVGETGVAHWRTRHFGPMRVRMVEYSANYLANHWCEKGHIVLCISGDLTTELTDGSTHSMRAGMSYHVADQSGAHRSRSTSGATLFIVD